MDCHENFSNFLAMTQSNLPRHCEEQTKRITKQSIILQTKDSTILSLRGEAEVIHNTESRLSL
ncbi:hypothetical protein [Helicobacter rodentium]|uniref:hypothetical protein n=1 Tax=Helicobacter rodentium TaxID=59617 RepID=UPI000A500F36|nr:hypothetical protein [Helicobacter rodentium]